LVVGKIGPSPVVGRVGNALARPLRLRVTTKCHQTRMLVILMLDCSVPKNVVVFLTEEKVDVGPSQTSSPRAPIEMGDYIRSTVCLHGDRNAQSNRRVLNTLDLVSDNIGYDPSPLFVHRERYDVVVSAEWIIPPNGVRTIINNYPAPLPPIIVRVDQAGKRVVRVDSLNDQAGPDGRKMSLVRAFLALHLEKTSCE
ncbi:hypothetical protein PFISCL1PPCAC_23296, partial [Pristionchus fissidentatus]